MHDLLTDADLAARFRLDLTQFHALRKRHGWPCVKLGRFEYRFTEEQVEQIVAMHAIQPERAKPIAVAKPTSLTKRSAARRRVQ